MSTGEASSILQELVKTTDQAVNTLEARAAAGVDLESAFADIQKKFEQAAELKDQRERETRMKVLEANFDDLRSDATKEEQDLAKAVFGLNAMIESMGQEYNQLTQLNSQEQQLIKDAENKLSTAKEERTKADSKWFFRETAIAQADQDLKLAEQQLEEAKSEARRQSRSRLLNANIEQNLQEFMFRVEKTVEIMQRRMGEIGKQLEIVSLRKKRAFEVREEAAKALEKLDQDLNKREADLGREEELVLTMESGSQEHAAQTAKISELRARVEELRGARNTAFVLHQSKDKFAAELEIHERTQMKLRDNQRMWITSLKSDTEERVVTFRSRLEAMKAASDQDIAKTLDDLGAEADQRNAEYMARVGAASDRLRMEKIEKHPKRIAEIAKVAAAQAEAIQQIRVREQKAIEEFKRLYGIDPTASSFFHYQDDEAEGFGGTSSGGTSSGGSSSGGSGNTGSGGQGGLF